MNLPIKNLLLASIVITAAIVIPACQGLTAEEVAALRQDVAASRTALETDLAQNRKALADAITSLDHEKEAKATKAIATDEQLLELLNKGETVFNASLNPDGTIAIQSGGAAVAALVPPPYNIAVLLASQFLPDIFSFFKQKAATSALLTTISTSKPPVP